MQRLADAEDREQQTLSPKKENINDADCQGMKYGKSGVSVSNRLFIAEITKYEVIKTNK